MSIQDNEIQILKTSRLTLRPFRLEDAQEVQRQAGNIKVAEMTATIPHPYLDGLAEEWIGKHKAWFQNGEMFNWAIVKAETQQLMGCISLGVSKAHHKAEVGYWVGEEFWGQGYCTEAAMAAFEYAFTQTNINKITSRHLNFNPASGKVMSKAGMEKEGFLKEDMFRMGKFVDMVVYGFLKSSWQHSKKI